MATSQRMVTSRIIAKEDKVEVEVEVEVAAGEEVPNSLYNHNLYQRECTPNLLYTVDFTFNFAFALTVFRRYITNNRYHERNHGSCLRLRIRHFFFFCIDYLVLSRPWLKRYS